MFVYDRQTNQTTLASIDSSGLQGNNGSYTPPISADGRYVAFYSNASNLVSGDTNNTYDVFVHDRQTNQTTLASIDSSGLQGNSNSQNPSISADGRYVAFYSFASNLVSDDTNGYSDVFVHDRQTNQTTPRQLDSSGLQGNNTSSNTSISADGHYVAFHSIASNLVSGDTNNTSDIFVYDRQTNQTTRVSVNSATPGNNGPTPRPLFLRPPMAAMSPSTASPATWSAATPTTLTTFLSTTGRRIRRPAPASIPAAYRATTTPTPRPSAADGRYVAFFSYASNLVSGDTNGYSDVFVHDRETNQTTRVSVNSSGLQGNGQILTPRPSAGRWPLCRLL